MKKTILLHFFLCVFVSVNVNAQTKTIKAFSRNDAEISAKVLLIPNGKETYSYYEDANGNYIKNGAYSLTGSMTKTLGAGSKITETKKTTATFKDNYLNGTLSVVYTGVGTYSGKPFNSSESFVAGYLNGVPHGKWTWKETTDGQTNSSEMTFTKGFLTGLYKYNETSTNSENLSKEVSKISGQFNEKGEFTGTWNETYSYDNVFSSEKTVTEMIFSNGVLLSCIKRDGAGKLLNPDSLRAEKKTLATQYAAGSISKDVLFEKGYTLTEGKVSLHCVDLNTLGGDKIDDVILGKPYVELERALFATDKVVDGYYKNEIQNILNKNMTSLTEYTNNCIVALEEYPSIDTIDKSLSKYQTSLKNAVFVGKYYVEEGSHPAIHWSPSTFYLTQKQVALMDSLYIADSTNFVTLYNDLNTKYEEAKKQEVERRIKFAEEQKKIAAEENDKREQKVETIINQALSRFVTFSSNPTYKLLGYNAAIRSECNINENWKNMFVTDTEGKRYQKADGSYGFETPQEIKLKELFLNLCPIASYKILGMAKVNDANNNVFYEVTVEFEKKTKKKEPNLLYQSTLLVNPYYEGIYLDYSMKNIEDKGTR